MRLALWRILSVVAVAVLLLVSGCISPVAVCRPCPEVTSEWLSSIVQFPSAWRGTLDDWTACLPLQPRGLLPEDDSRPWEVTVDSSTGEIHTTRHSSDLPLTVEVVARSLPLDRPLGPGDVSFLTLRNGVLLGVDQGEYGGGVFWLGEGKTVPTRVSEYACHALAVFGQQVLAGGGFCELTEDCPGHLLVIDVAGDQPRVKREIRLPRPAGAIGVSPRGTALVLCDRLIMELSQDLLPTPLYGHIGISGCSDYPSLKATWDYPESCTIQEIGKFIFIGTRRAIVVLERTPAKGTVFEEFWLVPKAERKRYGCPPGRDVILKY